MMIISCAYIVHTRKQRYYILARKFFDTLNYDFRQYAVSDKDIEVLELTAKCYFS